MSRRTKLVALVCTLAGAAGALLVSGLASTIAQSGSRSPQYTTVQDDAESGGLLFVQNAAGGSMLPGEGPDRFRLVLDGVDPRALYFSDRPRRIAGVLTVPEMLRTLGFGKKGEPDPNAVVEVDTGSGRDALAIELMRPRYDGGTDTLSFVVNRLKAADASARTPFRAKLQRFGDSLDGSIPQHFGEAALFIDDGGNNCEFGLKNNLSQPLTLVSASHWSTDSWDGKQPYPPPTVPAGATIFWQSDGGFSRGCGNSATYAAPDGQQMTFSGTSPYAKSNTASCSNSQSPSPQYPEFCAVGSYSKSGDLQAPVAVCGPNGCVLPPPPSDGCGGGCPP